MSTGQAGAFVVREERATIDGVEVANKTVRAVTDEGGLVCVTLIFLHRQRTVFIHNYQCYNNQFTSLYLNYIILHLDTCRNLKCHTCNTQNL